MHFPDAWWKNVPDRLGPGAGGPSHLSEQQAQRDSITAWQTATRTHSPKITHSRQHLSDKKLPVKTVHGKRNMPHIGERTDALPLTDVVWKSDNTEFLRLWSRGQRKAQIH